MHEHEPSGEIEEVQFITLSRHLYEEGTLGYIHFPEILEGRVRPSDFADKKIGAGEKSDQTLADMGINTLSDLLCLTKAELDSIPGKFRHNIESALNYQIRRLEERTVITGSQKLIGAVFGATQSGPVEPKDEPLILQTVEDALGNLSETEQAVLKSRFGLVDEKMHTLEEVGNKLGVARERVRQIESRALARLRNPSNKWAENLKTYLTLPKMSLGREILGLTYERDLPNLPIPLDEIELSQQVLAELYELGDHWMNYFIFSTVDAEYKIDSGRDLDEESLKNHFKRFLKTGLDFGSFSQEAAAELSKKINRVIRKYSRTEATSDLLEELSLPYGTTGVVRDTQVSDFKLHLDVQRELSDNGFNTIGALMQNEKVRSLSPKTVHEVGLQTAKMSLYLGEIVASVED